jgi:hypothetical protein
MSLVSAAWTHKLKQESIYSPGSLQERQEQAQKKNSGGGGGGANIGRGGGVDAPDVCMDWKKLAMFCI